MRAPFFNMSRTLSIGNEGPRAVEFALGPIYLRRNPVGQRVSGSMPVRQFNIRPSRMKLRCISLLRPAPPFRLSCDVHGGFAAARKKFAVGGQRPSNSGFRERPGYVGDAPSRPSPPCGPRPSTSALSRRWPRSTPCRRRPSRGACRPAVSRRRWRGLAIPIWTIPGGSCLPS